MTGVRVIPFNPLDKRHLGESVGQAMLRQSVIPMTDLASFDGAGIYAIYYQGDFPAYAAISEKNQRENFVVPIYVGKAVPKGARKGGDLDAAPGKVLSNRLLQHKRSIEEAINLDSADMLHPGRSWADRCQSREETAEQIITEVRDYLRNHPPPDDSAIITG